MKFIRNTVIVLVLLVVLVFLVVNSYQVDIVEEDLPQDVYESDANIATIIASHIMDIFIGTTDNEYTLVEDVVNLVIYDSIVENVNPEYDPLGDCDTDECNYIVQEEHFYIDYMYAELTEDDQLMVHVGVGSNSVYDFHTIVHFYFDVDLEPSDFEIVLTLDKILLDETDISLTRVDSILSNFDKDAIEAEVTQGELDLDEYTYTISINPLSSFFPIF